jgi:hypothetical protein
VSDFEAAMYDLLTEALILRAACTYDNGRIPEFLAPLMEALDSVEVAAPTSLMEANDKITGAVARVLGKMP